MIIWLHVRASLVPHSNIRGQDINVVIVSPHQGVKLVPAGDGSECYVTYEPTLIECIQVWKELFSAGA